MYEISVETIVLRVASGLPYPEASESREVMYAFLDELERAGFVIAKKSDLKTSRL